jgi:hypothetical protein
MPLNLDFATVGGTIDTLILTAGTSRFLAQKELQCTDRLSGQISLCSIPLVQRFSDLQRERPNSRTAPPTVLTRNLARTRVLVLA